MRKSDKFRLGLSAGDTTQVNLPETLRRGWEGAQTTGNQDATQGNLPETLRRGWEGGTVRSFLKRLAPESPVQLPGEECQEKIWRERKNPYFCAMIELRQSPC